MIGLRKTSFREDTASIQLEHGSMRNSHGCAPRYALPLRQTPCPILPQPSVIQGTDGLMAAP